MRAGRRADRKIRAVQHFTARVIRPSIAPRGHDGLAVVVAAQGHGDRAALRPQGGGRKAAHLAVADHDRTLSLERAEKLRRAPRADLGRGRGHAGQPCLSAHALARRDRAPEHRVQHSVHGLCLARERHRALDLRDDLVVAENLTLQPGGDLHQMMYSVLPGARDAVAAVFRRVKARRLGQHRERVELSALCAVQIQFSPVAGREQHTALHAFLRRNARQQRLHLPAHQRDLLALFQRRMHKVNARHTQIHNSSPPKNPLVIQMSRGSPAPRAPRSRRPARSCGRAACRRPPRTPPRARIRYPPPRSPQQRRTG